MPSFLHTVIATAVHVTTTLNTKTGNTIYVEIDKLILPLRFQPFYLSGPVLDQLQCVALSTIQHPQARVVELSSGSRQRETLYSHRVQLFSTLVSALMLYAMLESAVVHTMSDCDPT